MSVNIVARSVDQAIQETVQKRIFFGEKDILLNPNKTPLLAMTTRLGNRKSTTTTGRAEWIEDDFVPHWGQANSAGDIASGATTIPVVDGTLFAVNDLIAIPKSSQANSAAEEIVRVTANAANVLTITRNIGGAGADTIGATADLRILGSAYAENAGVGTVRNTTKNVVQSFCQIWRRPSSISKSMVAQAQFGPSNERLFQRQKALDEHKEEIESTGIWGRPSEALGLPGTIRTTMGLKSRIVTNLYNANTTLTEGGLLSFAELSFGKYYKGDQKLLLASIKVISAFDYFASGKVRNTNSETVLGVKTKRYQTSHGDFMIVRDLLLENAPVNSATGFGDEAYAIDVESVFFVPLSGNGENRDTHLLTDVIRTGVDGYTDEWLTEAAWGFRFEKRHSRLFNVTAYA